MDERIKSHNRGKVRSTKGHRPFELIYTENYSSKGSAQKREYFLKSAAGNIWLRNKLTEEGLW